MPSRRAILAGLAAGLAGCAGPRTSTDRDADPPEEQSPHDGPTRSAGSHRTAEAGSPECTEGVTLTVSGFDPVERLPVDLPARDRQVVERAVADGAAETVQFGATPPVEDGAYTELDGRYYRLGVRRTSTDTVPALTLNVEWEAGQTAPETPVPFADLPEVDQRALRDAVFGGERGQHPTEGLSVRESPVPYPDGVAESRFVEATAGDWLWVRWNDRTYGVWSGGTTTDEQYTFRVTAADVAGDAAGFRAHVDDRVRVPVAQFDSSSRTLLRTASADSYEECEPVSDRMRALRSQLSTLPTLPPPYDDAWLVALSGKSHLVRVTDWVV